MGWKIVFYHSVIVKMPPKKPVRVHYTVLLKGKADKFESELNELRVKILEVVGEVKLLKMVSCLSMYSYDLW